MKMRNIYKWLIWCFDMYFKGLKGLLYLLTILLLVPSIFSSGWHPADQIVSGEFTESYNFTGPISVINNDGLSIGTDVPLSDLTVYDEGSTGISFINSHSGTQGADGSFIGLGATDPILRINQQENADIRFFNNGERTFTISGSGNVAIGNGQPSSRLHVFGTTLTSDLIVSNQVSCGYLYTDASGNVLCYDRAPDTSERVWNESGGDIYLYNTTSNVGVGTLDPNEKFQVVGNAQFGAGGAMGFTDAIIKVRNDGDGSMLGMTRSGVRSYILEVDSTGNLSIIDNDAGPANRFTIDTSGNVGIGQSSPESLLDVSGDIHLDRNELIFSRNNNGASDKVSIDGSAASMDFFSDGGFRFFESDSNNQVVMIDGNSGRLGVGTQTPVSLFEVANSNSTSRGSVSVDIDQGNRRIDISSSGVINAFNTNSPSVSTNGLQLQTGGSLGVFIDGSQNVGIGTTSPQSRLQIGENSANVANILILGKTDSDSPESNLPRLHHMNANIDGDANNDLAIGSASSGGGIAFFTGNTNSQTALLGSNSNAARMVIDVTGNVGIGTTSPGGNLQVVGDSGSAGRIYISDIDNGESVSDSFLMAKSGTNAFVYNRDNGDLRLGTNNDNDMVVIDSTGNVGIGETNPGVELDVSGEGRFTSGSGNILTIESTSASGRSTLKFNTNGRDWELGARGSSGGPNNHFYLYDNQATAYRLTIDPSGNIYAGSSGSNLIWHQGNDGPGSGLNADLLDGQSGAYYLDNTDYCSGGTCGSLSLYGNLNMNNNGITNINWGASDDGSGSGLDADRLDGINSGSFLRSDTSDQMYVNAHSPDSNTYTLELYSPDTGDANNELSLRFHQGSQYYAQIRYRSGGFRFTDGNDGDFQNIRAGNIYSNNNLVWHPGNDGSGSGLDADLLDGQNSNAFVAVSGDTMTGNLNMGNNQINNINRLDINAGEGLSIRNGGDKGSYGNDARIINLEDGNPPTDGGLWITNDVSTRGDAGNDITVFHRNGVEFFVGSNQLRRSGNVIWDAGNDGPGSGLNADLLDGQSGAYYLDNTDYCSGGTCGSLSLSGNLDMNDNNIEDLNYIYGNFGTIARSTDEWLRLNDGVSHTSGVYFSSSTVRTDGELQVGGSGSTFRVSGSTFTYQGNDIWHAGNDGSGSGLSADNLDGINSGSFLRSDTSDTFSGGALSFGSSTRQMINLYASSYGIGIQSNTQYYRSGRDFAWFEGGSHSNTRLDAGGGTRVMHYDGINNEFYVHDNQVWHQGNDGTGSGLNADLWDGNQFSSYLNQGVRTSDSPTFNGVITDQISDSSGSQLVLNAGESSSQATGQTGELVYVNAEGGLRVTSSPDNWGSGWAGRDETTITGTAITVDGNTVWHAGNDGSGSGLDSDRLDGQQGSYYLDNTDYCSGGSCGSLSLSGNLNMGGNSITNIGTLNSNGADIRAFTNRADDGSYEWFGWYSGGSRAGIFLWDGSWSGCDANKFCIVGDTHQLMLRSNTGNVLINDNLDLTGTMTSGTVPWARLSGHPSINAGTGLTGGGSLSATRTINLDTGYTDGRYVRETGDTMTGLLTTRGSSGGIGVGNMGTPGIDVRSSGASDASYMTFHRPGSYAVRFGLDTDNQLKVGGWSMGSNAYEIWHEGNDGSGSGLDSDRLDGQQGSYYLDNTDYCSGGTCSGNLFLNSGNLYVSQPGLLSAILLQYDDGGQGTTILARSNSDWSDSYRINNNLLQMFANGGTLQWNGATLSTGGNTFWHQGNDGSGSGLDSDRLDGITSGSFLRSDTEDSTSAAINIGGEIIGSSAMLQVDGFMRTGTIYIHEGGGSPNSNNLPLSNNGGNLQWNSNTVWHGGNDGSGSGLDADRLDGQQGSYYLDNTDYCSGGSCPGSLTLTGGNRIITSNGGYAMFRSTNSHVYIDSAAGSHVRIRTNGNTERLRISSNGDIVGYGRIYADNGLHVRGDWVRVDDDRGIYFQNYGGGWHMQDTTWLRSYGGKSIYTTNQVRADNGLYVDGSTYGIDGAGRLRSNSGATIAGQTAWHAGNDGSGSGLDSDRLDGQQGSYYLDNTDYCSGGTCSGDDIRLDNPSSSTYDVRLVSSYDYDGWFRLVDGGGAVRFSVGRNGEAYIGLSNEMLWHQGNDGSGSGLSADNIDGVNSNQFLRSDTTDYMSGNLWFTGGTRYIGTSSNDDFFIRGNNANMIHIEHSTRIRLKAQTRAEDDLAPWSDNAVNLGFSNRRWANIYGITSRSNAFYYTSDERLKENITNLESSTLDKIKLLNGVSFEWKNKSMGPNGTQFGFIAQEVEEIFPALVDTDEDGYKSVQYTSFVPVLVEAVKEQQDTIEKQQSEIDQLKALVCLDHPDADICND